MYKIMLADDEGIVIDSLKFIIEKEFKNQCEVEYGKTGRSVIELAERMRPDIAIMDIMMPGINGIEAIRQIKERDPHVIFIIISAYDKFTYAKEAINLGVLDYLNKPLNRTEIVNVLRIAMSRIDEDRQKRSKELMIREKMETVLPIIENGLVYDILFRENYKEDIDNYKNILEIQSDYGQMAVLIGGDDQDGSHLTNAVGSSVRIQRNYAGIRDILKQYLNGIVGSAMGNKIVLFLPYDKEKMDYRERIELIERAREMTRSLRKNYQIVFRFGIGSNRRWEELPASYNEALKALTSSDGSVAHADDIPVKPNYEADYPLEAENGLFDAVGRRDVTAAIQNANEFYDWMAACYPDDLDDIRLKVIEFVIRAESVIYYKVGGLYRFQSRKDFLSQVMSMTELEEIRKWFLEKIAQICQNALIQQSEHSDSVISRARKYMEDNFSRTDISLDDVSREVDISPYYFSKLFKEETGQNFIDYLTSIRMEKAKQLLAASDCSMKEICAKIGYSDPNYFSRTFKKNIGVTPTEYKERGGQV